MRRAALVLLLAACVPDAPLARITGREQGEPDVAVYLRSLGSWSKLQLEGKGGCELVLDGRDARVRRDGPFEIVRDEGGIRLDGALHASLTLLPVRGVFVLDGRAFAGRLVFRHGRLINVVPLENYVLGVLRGELPLPEVPAAAAAAQAIAVRSYTFHYLEQRKAEFDVDDTTLFQRYVGLRYAPQDDHLRAGVRATRGEYLAWNGHPLKAYYHSTCGGHTTDIRTGLGQDNVPPMRGVACEHCRASKYYRWQSVLTEAEILKAARLNGPLRGLSIAERGTGGRALRLGIEADRTSRVLLASEFRLRAGPSHLRSTLILGLEPVAGGYRVEGAGWGHGVGLCQMGAIGLAKEGATGEEIAAYYYPGAVLSRAY